MQYQSCIYVLGSHVLYAIFGYASYYGVWYVVLGIL